MTPRVPMLVTAVGLAALLCGTDTGAVRHAASGGLQLPFENNRVRITELSVPAGASLPAAANRVLDLPHRRCRRPDARRDAVWQSADAGSDAEPRAGDARGDRHRIQGRAARPGRRHPARSARCAIRRRRLDGDRQPARARDQAALWPDRLRRTAAPASRGRHRGLSAAAVTRGPAPICGARRACIAAAWM